MSYVDYRNVTGKYDRLINVGFLEHVSPKFYKTFFKKISDLMKDDAICLIHSIASIKPPNPGNPFISKNIFFWRKNPSRQSAH